MKKLLFGVVFILIGIAVAYTMLIVPARRLTYPDNSKLTKYPGNTQMTRQVSEHVIVNPKGEGMPLEVSQSEKYKYSPDAYELYDIPQQTKLSYAVGSFEKWVDIEGSRDKYIVLTHAGSNIPQRYRVAFQQSELYTPTQETTISVEQVGLPPYEKNAMIRRLRQSKTADIGYQRLKLMLWRGDTVLITPVWDPPQLSKSDETGAYPAAWIGIRRVW